MGRIKGQIGSNAGNFLFTCNGVAVDLFLVSSGWAAKCDQLKIYHVFNFYISLAEMKAELEALIENKT